MPVVRWADRDFPWDTRLMKGNFIFIFFKVLHTVSVARLVLEHAYMHGDHLSGGCMCLFTAVWIRRPANSLV